MRSCFETDDLLQAHSQLFENTYPCLVKGQGKEFRLACFKFIEILRKSQVANTFPLLQSIMARKSDLDDFRGERFERIILILTSALLESILGRFASEEKENAPKLSKEKEYNQLQVCGLSVAHNYIRYWCKIKNNSCLIYKYIRRRGFRMLPIYPPGLMLK